jgi:glyoxylase-like metal-dependent hydrolase (beta-lactamase superfamily II)
MIHQLHIPTSLAVGPVNVHLIEGTPLTLVDTGPKTPEALEALRDGLHALGRRIEDIERVVLTHMHEDHCGLATTIHRASGATIFAHPWEANRLRGYDERHLYVSLFERAGVPQDVIGKFAVGFERIRELADDIEEVEGIEDGDHVDFESFSFEVVHTPGHTPGSICLFRASDRTMIAADTVLKNITPNPVLSPDPIDPSRRFPSLLEWLTSLARIRTLAPTLVKGGHGGDVEDYDEHFMRMVRFTDERQRSLVGLLSPSGSTAWQASLRLFPDAKGSNRFLALSETVAHLDLAVYEERALVTTLDDSEVELYRPIRGF